MASLPSDNDAVLSANLEFYRAFAGRDAVAMETIWATDAPVVCVHPGWTPVVGRVAVLESWRHILANPEAPSVMCHDKWKNEASKICAVNQGHRFSLAGFSTA